MIITSTHNPRVKYIVGLRERRERERVGLMRVEGYEEVSMALACGARPAELFFCPPLFPDAQQKALVEQIWHTGAELFEVSDRVFERIAYRENPDGWLATFPSPRRALHELPLGDSPFLVVAEAVEKPGNLGAMLRTADAAGVDALIACDPRTDWGNPNVVRASKNALFSVPVAEVDSAQTLVWLRAHGIAIVAATPQADPLYYEANLRGPVAIAVGTEKEGLSQFWLDAADVAVRIPMAGQVDSLNVATATALLLYEVVRQRGEKAKGRR